MEAVQKQALIDWCDQQVKDGKELALCWDGGGDSGWVYFEVDEEQTENEYTNKLVDMMYDQLDYGSWAGEFSAQGKAIYNAETKCFEGIDYYSEDYTEEYPCSIRLEVPADVWFDTLSYGIEDEAVVEVRLDVRNGFTTDRHEEVAKAIQESFDDQLDAVIEKFNNDPDTNEFRSIWEDRSVNRSEFVQEGDKLVHIIESIGIGTYTGEEKDVTLDLNFLLDLENDEEDDLDEE